MSACAANPSPSANRPARARSASGGAEAADSPWPLPRRQARRAAAAPPAARRRARRSAARCRRPRAPPGMAPRAAWPCPSRARTLGAGIISHLSISEHSDAHAHSACRPRARAMEERIGSPEVADFVKGALEYTTKQSLNSGAEEVRVLGKDAEPLHCVCESRVRASCAAARTPRFCM